VEHATPLASETSLETLLVTVTPNWTPDNNCSPDQWLYDNIQWNQCVCMDPPR
jgi:hypothetical protein